MNARDRRRAVVMAGHRGDVESARVALTDEHPGVRASALTALERAGGLVLEDVEHALRDPDPAVRRRASTLAGRLPGLPLDVVLDDPDPTVVEVAAWACGEQEAVADATLDRLIALVTEHDDALVREAAAAALGAIGDERGLPAILAAGTDKPAVRRRAVLALAPFDGAEVDAAVDRALTDRDWQVRQAAEDLRRAAGDIDL